MAARRLAACEHTHTHTHTHTRERISGTPSLLPPFLLPQNCRLACEERRGQDGLFGRGRRAEPGSKDCVWTKRLRSLLLLPTRGAAAEQAAAKGAQCASPAG